MTGVLHVQLGTVRQGLLHQQPRCVQPSHALRSRIDRFSADAIDLKEMLSRREASGCGQSPGVFLT